MSNKALVISGGGSWGAWGAGLCTKLSKNREYKYFSGSSTGSLISAMCAAQGFDSLKKAYTTIDNSSIYDNSPYKNNGKLKLWSFAKSLILGRQSLSSAKPLERLITKYYTEAHHDMVNNSDEVVFVSAHNLDSESSEYIRSDEVDITKLRMWLLASSSAPLFMKPAKIGDSFYVDSGVSEHIPLKPILSVIEDIDEIDIVIHKRIKPRKRPKNLLSMLDWTLSALMKEVSESDLLLLYYLNEHAKINIYTPDFVFVTSSLFFEKEMMRKWFDRGYRTHAKVQHIPKGTFSVVV